MERRLYIDGKLVGVVGTNDAPQPKRRPNRKERRAELRAAGGFKRRGS